MGVLSFFSRSKFDDVRIVNVANRAIEDDPSIENPQQLIVTSKNGVITLSGVVSTDRQSHHLEGVVDSALKSAGVKHAEVVNQVAVAA